MSLHRAVVAVPSSRATAGVLPGQIVLLPPVVTEGKRGKELGEGYRRIRLVLAVSSLNQDGGGVSSSFYRRC